ncbi:hypothetical protein [Actinomadura sp. B10D3]|uniref:hypothetical protein n=1 Tax=Actinomadura sp. B10D3 TaxID=3153557 RepID=UPI00325DE30D
MTIDDWWGLVERARAAVGDRADDRNPPDDPLPGALADLGVSRRSSPAGRAVRGGGPAAG